MNKRAIANFHVSLEHIGSPLSQGLLFRSVQHSQFSWTREDVARMWTLLYAGRPFGTVVVRHELPGAIISPISYGDRWGDEVRFEVPSLSQSLPVIHVGVQRLRALAMTAFNRWCLGRKGSFVRYQVGFNPVSCEFRALTSESQEDPGYVNLDAMVGRNSSVEGAVERFLHRRNLYLLQNVPPLDLKKVEDNLRALHELLRAPIVQVCQLSAAASAWDLAQVLEMHGHNQLVTAGDARVNNRN